MGTFVRSALRPALLLLLVMGVYTVAKGQDGAGSTTAIGHPGYLQRGTCDQPGDPVAALAMTSTGGGAGGADPSTPPPSQSLAIPAAVSVTDIDLPLTEILQSGLVVRVVASADEPDSAIACGAVDGQPDDDGNVYLALTERDGSGVTGVVWFQQGDDDVTTVTLFLVPAAAPDRSAG